MARIKRMAWGKRIKRINMKSFVADIEFDQLGTKRPVLKPTGQSH